jgi:hypothetical protein
VDEFYARQLLEAAIVHDQDWWKSDVAEETLPALQTLAEAVESQRTELLSELLSPTYSRSWRRDVRFWEAVPLTGSVLGSLSLETHRQVQEICRRELEACRSFSQSRSDPVAVAKAREKARRELARALNREQFDEFLLRYSPSSSRLRAELAGLGPSLEEFRALFAALDPVDQQMRLEYGDVSRLSAGQRRQYHQLRQETIRQVLSVERYQAYLGMVGAGSD